jgi:murein DD-endopeptidase MepM/ murein hydrolase activator NlpD
VGKAFIKKRGSVMAIMAIVGGLITILLTSFGMATLGTNLFENATLRNDAFSSLAEKIGRQQLNTIFSGDDAGLCGSSMTIKCKYRKLSYKALSRFESKGVVALDSNGNTIDTSQKGYPEKNPSSYSIDMGDGKAPRVVASGDMPDFLSAAENKKIAYKVIGRGGAINMRFRSWTGKYITKRLFRVFNLSRKGGIAKNSSTDAETGKPKTVSPEDRIKDQKESIPKSDSAGGGADSISSKTTEKIRKLSGKVAKGGAAYGFAVRGCIAVKLPGIIASSAAAVQLAQLLPLAQDTVLSSGSMQKAAGLGSGFTEEASEALGNFLTTRVMDENGNLKSPLDSPILLSAIGVITSKLAIPEDLAPGFSFLTNPITQLVNNMNDATKEACSVIMSPYTMYTVMAIQAGAAMSGVATIPTLLNLAAGFLMDDLTDAILSSQAFQDLASKAATQLLTNDSITEAIAKGGLPGGNAIGLAIISFFGLGGISRHMPVLKESQVTAFNNIQKENEQFQRDLEIAALSPFDTSSRYTFLGSIVHNMSIAMLKRGNYNDSFSSILSNVFSLPGIALSSFTSSANAFNDLNYCSYGKEWHQTAGEAGKDTAAVTIAGTPCLGYIGSMPYDEAIDILSGEKWIDQSIKPEGDPENLISIGYIKKATPLADFMEDCGDPSSGSYLFNAPSCTIDEGTNYTEPSVDTSQVGETGQQAATVDTELKDSRAMEAIVSFLLNYQVMQSINGEDEGEPEEDSSTSGSSTDSGITGEVDPNGWASPVQSGNVVTSPYGYRDGPFNGYEFHDGVDLSGSNGPIFAVRDGTVTAVGVAPGGGWGNWISIDHGEVAGVGHIYSFYAHLASVNVSVGDTVKAGQQIGVMGTTGNSTGVHLHFGIYKIQPGDSDKNGSTTYNPAEVLPSLTGGG